MYIHIFKDKTLQVFFTDIIILFYLSFRVLTFSLFLSLKNIQININSSICKHAYETVYQLYYNRFTMIQIRMAIINYKLTKEKCLFLLYNKNHACTWLGILYNYVTGHHKTSAKFLIEITRHSLKTKSQLLLADK